MNIDFNKIHQTILSEMPKTSSDDPILNVMTDAINTASAKAAVIAIEAYHRQLVANKEL